MRKFIINVNGSSYEVEVEEVGGSASAAPVAAPKAAPAAPAAAPKAAPAPAAAPAGATSVNAPMPGTIIDVKVSVGDTVQSGDVLCILEAMKMENEICAPQDGTVATVECSVGDSVETGKVLVSMN